MPTTAEQDKPRFFIARNGFIKGEKFIEAIGAKVFITYVDGTRVEEAHLKVGYIEEMVRLGLWKEFSEPPRFTLPEAVDHILLWASEKGIIGHSTPEAQLSKLREEVEELSEEVYAEDVDAQRLEAGDVGVVWVILCHILGMGALECLTAAYEKIEKRSGKIVDGVFVKDKPSDSSSE